MKVFLDRISSTRTHRTSTTIITRSKLIDMGLNIITQKPVEDQISKKKRQT